ncbi:MAG: Ig-like domain-containing protein [Longimicrobiales bacterium]
MKVMKQSVLKCCAMMLGAAVAFTACDEPVVSNPPTSLPVSLVVVSGNDQSALVGTELTSPLVVRVLNASEQPVRGQIVNWRVLQGGGELFAGVGITNSNGIAQERWRLGPTPGAQRVEARAISASTGEALTFGTFNATALANAVARVASVTVTPSPYTVQLGGTGQLTATTRDSANNILTNRVITWSSSNTSIATVGSSGSVQGIGVGTATVTATSEGRSGTATVNVTAPSGGTAPVATVAVSPSNPSVPVGSSVQLTTTLRDANNNILSGRVVTWSSSITARATVNSSGLVTAVSAGTATITATSETRSGTATVTITAPPPPPPPSTGVVWFSDWSAATGLTDFAVTDGGTLSGGRWAGGKWDYITCWPPDIMRVVPGGTLGWTTTPNVLEMTDRGETTCDLLELDNAIPSGRSFYIRAYIRVEPGVGGNNHPFKLNAGGGAGPVQAVLWANNSTSGTTYRQKMQFPGGNTPPNYNTWALAPQYPLQTNTWYRHEWFIELVNTTARQYRIWPRIYDMQGNLIRDASHFMIGDPSNDQTTMAQWYANGGGDRFTDLNLARRFTVGMEGPGGSPGTNRHWYYAAVAASVNGWIGAR